MSPAPAPFAEYENPPITEAVLEIRWSALLSAKSFQKLRQALKPLFPFEEEEQELEVHFDLANPSVRQLGISAYRFRSADAADVVVLRAFGLTVSRLAPYAGWSDLSGRMERYIDLLSSLKEGPKNRSRIGVRFLNRIDVPLAADNVFDPSTYVTIVPQRPGVLSAPAGSFATSVVEAPIDDYLVNVNFAKQPSPLLQHIGLFLDIDVFNNLERPLSTLAQDFVAARGIINSVFEGCITDRARGLFK